VRWLGLVVKNVFRSRRRTLLTTAGVGLAVLVVTSVAAIEAGFGTLASSAGDTLLAVHERDVACALSSRLFDAYLPSIRGTPRVVDATGVLRAMYSYQRAGNFVAVDGVDYEHFRTLKGIAVTQGSEAEFRARGDGALVGRRLARHQGWQVGQTVALIEDGLTFQVAGVFESADAALDSNVLLHKAFLGKVKHAEGKSTFLVVRVSDAAAVGPVAKKIDDDFANFPRPTKTQAEKAAKDQEVRDFAAVRWMLSGMVLATIIASVLGAANSLSMSVRERTREVGILRSLGLRRRHILQLLLGESLLVALVGGAIGLTIAAALLAPGRMLGGVVPLVLTPATALTGLGVAALIGLLGALVPALRAANARIVDTLRIVD